MRGGICLTCKNCESAPFPTTWLSVEEGTPQTSKEGLKTVTVTGRPGWVQGRCYTRHYGGNCEQDGIDFITGVPLPPNKLSTALDSPELE
jgi:hypothetical protein